MPTIPKHACISIFHKEGISVPRRSGALTIIRKNSPGLRTQILVRTEVEMSLLRSYCQSVAGKLVSAAKNLIKIRFVFSSCGLINY